MCKLSKELTEVRQRIKKAGTKGLNEQDTKASLIDPVLRALGWNTEDVEEVAREYRSKKSDNPVDYALIVMRTPQLLIEAKALGTCLDHKAWANQIMAYAAVSGIKWIVLTNGDEWRIYNSHAAVHVDQKLFRCIRVSNIESKPVSTLELLAKEQMKGTLLEGYWKAEFIDRQVQTELEAMFTPEADLSLANLIAGKLGSLSVEDVHASLSRCRFKFDFPVPADIDTPTHIEGSEVTLLMLIQAGIIQAPLQLKKTYKGIKLSATLEGDGSVVFEKIPYASPSAAGAHARASVVGFDSEGKPPSTNGWDFWSFSSFSGHLVSLAKARAMFQIDTQESAA